MLSPRSVVWISTFEKSGSGGAAGGCCANTGPANAMIVATAVIPTLFIPAPLRRFSDVLAQDCIGADRDRQAVPMDAAVCAPYAVSIQRSSAEFNGRRAQEETNVMTSPIAGGVDCDLHPAVPHLTSLLPYMNDYWRDQVTTRGMTDLVSQSYPLNSPITSRPDWRPANGKPGSSLEDMQAQALDRFGVRYAICNPLYGVQMVFSEDMADAFCRALNDWLVREWLDSDTRLRGSIVIPVQSIEKSVAEIERCAKDTRFVQVLMLVMGDMPLGKHLYWPIYAAAERLGLPIGIHAGSNYHNPPTSVGWGSYHIEDYVAQAQAFQTQLTSLIVEGVFARHPNLKMVMLESGFTWLPSYLWRLHKFWRGIRMETPWVDRAPLEIVRSNIRFSLQPIDAPPDPTTLNRLFDHMQSDELLLFSTDYPHWQFDGDAVLPEGMSSDLVRKIMIDNPHATYTRLKEPAHGHDPEKHALGPRPDGWNPGFGKDHAQTK